MVVHTCNPITWGMKAEGQPGLHDSLFQASKQTLELHTKQAKQNLRTIYQNDHYHNM